MKRKGTKWHFLSYEERRPNHTLMDISHILTLEWFTTILYIIRILPLARCNDTSLNHPHDFKARRASSYINRDYILWGGAIEACY